MAYDLLSLIDLTNLADDAVEEDIVSLCQNAEKYNVAAICVYPQWLQLCSQNIDINKIKLATVCNFPSGNEDLQLVLQEMESAINIVQMS